MHTQECYLRMNDPGRPKNLGGRDQGGIAIRKVFARPESFARNPWNCNGEFPDPLENF